MMVTTIMMKIMMKYDFTKEIVTWALNDTQPQNNAYTKPSPIDYDWVLLNT